MQSPDPDETPLDPAQERIVQKVRRLALGSSLIMMLGVLLVLGVIGYRLFATAERGTPDIEALVELPKGARVVSTAVGDGRLAVTVEIAGRYEVRFFDLSTLKPRGRLQLKPAP
jgi:hypothetical protein